MSETGKRWSIFGTSSIVICTVLMLLFINHFVELIPLQKTKLQGLPILLPNFIGPIGIVLGVIGMRKTHDRLSKWGTISNIGVSLLPQMYWVIGILLWGV